MSKCRTMSYYSESFPKIFRPKSKDEPTTEWMERRFKAYENFQNHYPHTFTAPPRPDEKDVYLKAKEILKQNLEGTFDL